MSELNNYITGETINSLCPISIYTRNYLNQFPKNKKYIKHIIYVGENNDLESILKNNTNIFFTKMDWIDYFITIILPEIHKPFILVTHHSDYPSGLHRIIRNHKLLIKWYGQNMSIIHPKTEGIPCGLPTSTWNTDVFNNIKQYNRNSKSNLLYLNFSLNTNANRKNIMNNLLCKGFTRNNTIPWNNYIKELSTYKFAISPQGNGVDCIRTWECLYLGVIPIVEKSTAMSYFDDLPILFVNSYDEINEEVLNKIYYHLLNKKFNLQKLNINYYKRIMNL